MRRLAILVGVTISFITVGAARADRANLGLKALADASTDVVVAEVISTQPRKAIEGARDTAQFKVVRTLKGPLRPGEDADVYYHLLWTDAERHVLEPPKFEAGKQYTLFLVLDSAPRSRLPHYNLRDQWLAVLPVHPELDNDILTALNEVGDVWSDYWRRQHGGDRGPLRASASRIEIVPEGNVIRSDGRLALSVKIVNHSSEPITTRIAHEWYGGEWPPTDLYASATHVQAKQPNPLEPVYLLGEEPSATAPTRIPPGESVTVALRMDWPGTGGARAKPLLSPTQSEAFIRILMVFETQAGAREYVASAATYVRVLPD